MPFGKAEFGQHLLRIAAVVLQPVAIGAAADDMEAVAAKLVLPGAEPFRHALEQDDPTVGRLAQPVEFGAPIGRLFDQAGQGTLRFRLADEDFDLVALGRQAQVKGAEVAGFTDTQKTH